MILRLLSAHVLARLRLLASGVGMSLRLLASRVGMSPRLLDLLCRPGIAGVRRLVTWPSGLRMRLRPVLPALGHGHRLHSLRTSGMLRSLPSLAAALAALGCRGTRGPTTMLGLPPSLRTMVPRPGGRGRRNR